MSNTPSLLFRLFLGTLTGFHAYMVDPLNDTMALGVKDPARGPILGLMSIACTIDRSGSIKNLKDRLLAAHLLLSCRCWCLVLGGASRYAGPEGAATRPKIE
jgi:hypothetical protein